MLGIGFGEMILIAGIALVIIGPEKFPEFAKIVLRTVRDLRGYVEEAKRDISKELKPVRREIQDLSRYNPEDYVETLAGSVMGGDEEDESAADTGEGSTGGSEDRSGAAEDNLPDGYESPEPASQDTTATDTEDSAAAGNGENGSGDSDHDVGGSETRSESGDESDRTDGTSGEKSPSL